MNISKRRLRKEIRAFKRAARRVGWGTPEAQADTDDITRIIDEMRSTELQTPEAWARVWEDDKP